MNHTIPSTIKNILMSAFSQDTYRQLNGAHYGILDGRKMFTVQSDKANEWLSTTFGLNTNDNEHQFEGFVFDFNWTTQKWMVGS